MRCFLNRFQRVRLLDPPLDLLDLTMYLSVRSALDPPLLPLNSPLRASLRLSFWSMPWIRSPGFATGTTSWVLSGSAPSPPWICPGSTLDLPWIHPGSSLDPFPWICPGSSLGPLWIRPGSALGPPWVHPSPPWILLHVETVMLINHSENGGNHVKLLLEYHDTIY